MNKLPVGQTIRFAYAFTFGEIGTVIGLIWIPTLINAVLAFFGVRAIYLAAADLLETAQPQLGGQLLLLIFVLVLATVMLWSMIAVAIARQALGLRKGPAYAHLSLGAAELRVFGGFFGLYSLLILFYMAFTIAAGGVMFAVGSVASGPAAAAGLGVLSLAGLCAIFYAAVRLSFLMVPAALDGNGVGLSRSWQLTQGNFWRILAVGLATLLPVLLLMTLAQGIIMGPEFFAPPKLPPAADAAANMKVWAGQMRATVVHLPLLAGLGFVVSPLLYGLLFAPAAFAYRALSGRAVVEASE